MGLVCPDEAYHGSFPGRWESWISAQFQKVGFVADHNQAHHCGSPVWTFVTLPILLTVKSAALPGLFQRPTTGRSVGQGSSIERRAGNGLFQQEASADLKGCSVYATAGLETALHFTGS